MTVAEALPANAMRAMAARAARPMILMYFIYFLLDPVRLHRNGFSSPLKRSELIEKLLHRSSQRVKGQPVTAIYGDKCHPRMLRAPEDG
jgi:hypothetical protein